MGLYNVKELLFQNLVFPILDNLPPNDYNNPKKYRILNMQVVNYTEARNNFKSMLD